MRTYKDFADKWQDASNRWPDASGKPDSLYVSWRQEGTEQGAECCSTYFLDALEAAKFEAPEREGKEKVSESEEGTV